MCCILLIGIVFFTNFTFLPLSVLLPLLFVIFWFYPVKRTDDVRFVWVAVLGDLGHSPRIVNQVNRYALYYTLPNWSESQLELELRVLISL